MTTFLLDIWHDLREKRLWPVAVGLLVATIAVPVVLFKPAGGAPKVEVPPATDTAALPVAQLDPTAIENSGLGTFDVNNPFASGADAPKTPGMTDGPGAAGGGSLTDSLFGGGGAGSGGGTAGGSGGTVPGGGSGGSGGSGGKRYFTYTVDVTFGKRDETEKFKNVDALTLLPDDANPIVSFMGMAKDASVAVFFIVDPAMQAEGEGDCNPTPENCRFVYLKVDDEQDEQTLSGAEGALEYTLRLDAIHIKYLTEGEATGDTTPDSSPDTPAAAKRKSQAYNLATHPLLSAGEIR